MSTLSYSNVQGVRARVLVVDDEANIRFSLTRALNRLGYETAEAESGRQALELLRQATYDLMVLDIRMPGMDGLEVMSQAHQLRPALLILVLTGHATLESAITAVKAHAADYLIKPASLAEITSAVARALAARADQQRQQKLLSVAANALRETAANALREAAALEANAAPDRPEPEPSPAAGEPAAEPRLKAESVLRAGPVALDLHKRQVIVNATPVRANKLTAGEVKVLAFLMSSPDRALSCRELALGIWGYELEEIEANSLLRPYIFRLRKKIEANPQEPRLIRTVHGVGYLFAAESS